MTQNRKPGVDLSPLLNFILMILLVYSMAFIETMAGGTQSFLDQVVTASIVNQTIIYALVLGIALMITERIVYKNNPKEWREYFQYKEKKQVRPMTLEELNFCLRKGLSDRKSLQELGFEKLEYDEVAHKEDIAQREKKTKKNSEVESKKKHDDSYNKNPLSLRYLFLCVLTVLSLLVCCLYLPIIYTLKRVNMSIFSLDEYKSDVNTNKDFVYFQSNYLFQIFYGLFISYLVGSALQIRLGESINKGKRELLSKFNLVYMSSLGLSSHQHRHPQHPLLLHDRHRHRLHDDHHEHGRLGVVQVRKHIRADLQ